MNFEFIAQQIHSKLRSYLGDSMPNHGVLAGQGLASMVLSHIWQREVPVEQLDYFQDWPDEELTQPESIYYSRPSLGSESYQLISQNGFCVLSSESSGLLSKHIIQRCQSNFGKDRVMIILHALALNAFGVGFDCYSKQLHTTAEFIEFVRSKQLRIQSPVSAESLLLLLKYRYLYNCYIDLEEEIELLTGFRGICDRLGLEKTYHNSVSAQGKLIYEKYKNLLEPLCSLVGEDNEEPVLPWLEVPLGIQYEMMFKKNYLPEKFECIISPFLKNNELYLDSYAFSKCHNTLLRKSSSNILKSRFKIAMSYPTTAFMALTDLACLDCDFTENHALIIEQFRKIHPLCIKALLPLNFSINQLYRAVLVIQAYSKQSGSLIVGLLETHKLIRFNLKEISKTSLDELVETYRINAGISLVEKQADLSRFEYRDRIRELTTTTELEIEGCKMNNCIGGYAARLQSDSGRTRIFHIDGPKPSTAAIYYNIEHEGISYEVSGISNSAAVEDHFIVIEHLGHYLASSIWSKTEHNESINN